MKTRYVALAVAAAMGLGSVSAFAQDYHHERREGAWQHERAEHHRRDWDHDRHDGRRYYAPSYSYRHDDDSGNLAGAVILGALTGALLGQAADNTYYSPPATYYSPPATYYAPPATYYTPPATYYTPPATTYYYGY